MINNGTRVAMVGAALIAVLSLGGLIELPKAFGVPPEGVLPEPNIEALVQCLPRNLSDDTCCPSGVETNAHMAIACIISACGPGCIPEPPGSMAITAELVRMLFGVGPDTEICNPCADPSFCLGS